MRTGGCDHMLGVSMQYSTVEQWTLFVYAVIVFPDKLCTLQTNVRFYFGQNYNLK